MPEQLCLPFETEPGVVRRGDLIGYSFGIRNNFVQFVRQFYSQYERMSWGVATKSLVCVSA